MDRPEHIKLRFNDVTVGDKVTLKVHEQELRGDCASEKQDA